MIGTLEGHRPDETLGSLIGRALAGVVVADRKGMGTALTGTYGGTLRLEFPMHLEFLSRELAWELGMSAREIVQRTTMLPLYAPFLEPDRYSRVLSAMLTDGTAVPASILGVHADQTPMPQCLRFCPVCRQLELKKYGFSWWHRAHQARGVEHCSIHRVRLLISQFRRGGAWKTDYPLADDAEGEAVNSIPDQLGFDIASDVQWLLSARLAPLGTDRLRAAYFEAAQTRGFVTRGRLRRSDLLRAFFDAHKRRWLGRLGLGFAPESPYSWPAKLLVGAGECHPPLRHIVLIRFLGLCAKSFSELALSLEPRPRPRRGPDTISRQMLRDLWPRRDISLNEIVRRIGANYGTVRAWATGLDLPVPRFGNTAAKDFVRKRDKLRSRLISCGGRPSKRRTRCIRWLSRNDHAWFTKNCPAITPRTAGSRIDWTHRDRELSARVPAAAVRIRGYRPLRRITIGGLAEQLECEGALQRAHGRLRRFHLAAAKVVEDSRAFLFRRIRTFRRLAPRQPVWLLMERATVPQSVRSDPDVQQALLGHNVR